MQILRVIYDAFSLLDRSLRIKAVLSLLATLVMVLFETFSVFLVYPLILALAGGTAAAQTPFLADVVSLLPQENRVAKVTLLIALLMAAKSVISVWLAWWQQGFVHQGAAIMAGRLLDQYMSAPILWHQTKNSAELQRNANVSVRLVFSNIILATLAIAGELVVLVLMSGVLMLVDPGAVLIAVAAFAASLVVYQAMFARLPAEAGRRLERAGMDVIKELNQALGATRELRLTGREDFVSRSFVASKMAQANAFRLIGTLAVVPRAYLELTVTIVLIAVVFWMSRATEGATAVAALGLFGAATLRFLPSIHRVLSQLQLIQIGAASLANVRDDLRQVTESSPRRVAGCATPPRTSITIRDVTFTYPEKAEPALDRVTATIARGECIGIVGASGAGKSTLVDVLLGLLTPQKGAVLVDGQDVSGQPSRWQGVAGYVPQSVFLLDDTLRRNIGLGLPDEQIDEADVRRAVDRAQLGPFVSAMPEGLDVVIGEHGVRISGGQRQRIGIARALYSDPAVLVMDEGTSALDNETEDRLTRAIELLRGDKTIVLVAHRLSTVQHCDRIIFMQNGQIVDQGTFDELTARHPDFARLVEIADLGKARRAAAPAELSSLVDAAGHRANLKD